MRPGILLGMCLAAASIGVTNYAQAFPTEVSSTVEAISIESAAELPLAVDRRARLLVNGVFQNKLEPFVGEIVWESLTPNIASVSEDGFVTGLNEGNARIKASVRPANQLFWTPVQKTNRVYFQAPDNWDQTYLWYWYPATMPTFRVKTHLAIHFRLTRSVFRTMAGCCDEPVQDVRLVLLRCSSFR